MRGETYTHAFHFNQPARTADRCQYDDGRMMGKTFTEKSLYDLVVGYVAQIDDEGTHIREIHIRFAKQGFHVFPHAEGLLADIAGMDNLSPVVDTGSTGDEGMPTVTVIDAGSAFETDTVFVSGVQVSPCVKVTYLFGRDAQDGIGIHQGGNGRISMASADTGTGDEMSIGSESLGTEHVIPCLHHSGVVYIDILDKEPGTYTVIGQCSAGFLQLLQMFNSWRVCSSEVSPDW